MHQLRLTSSALDVDVRLREFNGRWLASADTADGPSLGYGLSPVGALSMALESYGVLGEELLASLSSDRIASFGKA
jgi:hypothetical protein